MSSWRRFVWYWLPVLAWMAFIFVASSDPESGARGSRILGPVIRFFVPDIAPSDLDRAVLVARKAVHFGTFGLLAGLLWRALPARSGSTPDPRRTWLAFGVTLLYAIGDEVHQGFVPTRVASPLDVLVDSFGAASVLACLWALQRRRRRAQDQLRSGMASDTA